MLFRSASQLEYSDDELEMLKEVPLLSMKPVIYVANINEDELGTDLTKNPHYMALKAIADEEKSGIISICAGIEAEISELEPEEKKEFLADLGIEKSGLDYIALGHVHNHSGFEKAGKTVYSYSGCAVGRSFDECGYKYAIIGGITKENGEADVRLAPYKCSADKRFEIAKADISGSRSTDEALIKICDICREYGEDTSLRVVLTGEVSPEVQIACDNVRRVLKAPQYIELLDETLPIFDTEKLKNDMTIIGAFYRALEPKLLSSDADERKKATLALRYGLAALCGRDINA